MGRPHKNRVNRPLRAPLKVITLTRYRAVFLILDRPSLLPNTFFNTLLLVDGFTLRGLTKENENLSLASAEFDMDDRYVILIVIMFCL